MNSIFLRIYGGLLITLVLVALLGVFTFHQVNEVRADQYRESLARGTFRLMSDNLEPMTAIERRRALVLWSRLMGIPWRCRTWTRTASTAACAAALRKQVLVEQTGPHAAKVYSLVSEQEHLVLTGEVQQISEQLARATVYLLIDELVRFPVREQPQRLAALKEGKQFGFDLHLITLKDADLDEDQRRRVDEGDTVMALGKGGDSVRIFAGIVDTPWVLEIGPLYLMNPYPPELLVLIGLLGLSFIGLTIYLLVRQLERRLLGLEAAATRIAHGKLDARVPARGADSVGRLAAAFNGMAEQLQQLLSVQRELVRAVSHELRTPVARLRFGLEMIADAETESARRKYMEGMDGDIQELDKLVDEMLTYARLEQGTPALNFQRVDLDALFDQVIAELAPLRVAVRVERGQCLTASGEGAWVEAEPRYLHRALQNLVSNAMRHAEARVRLSYQIGHKRCRIDVEDDGPGVPESHWERIFTPSCASTTAAPAPPAAAAWGSPSCGGSSTGTPAARRSVAATPSVARASAWSGPAARAMGIYRRRKEVP